MIVYLDEVLAIFGCTNCEKKITVLISEVIEEGTPVCDCGWDMELASYKAEIP